MEGLQDFQIGDQVRLKSGGPSMRIRRIVPGGGWAVCEYCVPRPKRWNKTDLFDLSLVQKDTNKENPS